MGIDTSPPVIQSSATPRSVTAALIAAAETDRTDVGVLRRLLALHPANLATMNRLAEVSTRRGDGEHALRWRRHALTLDPGDWRLHADTATAATVVGSVPAALVATRRGLALRPEKMTLMVEIAEIAQSAGSRETADRLLRYSACLARSSSDRMRHLAMLRAAPCDRSRRHLYRTRHHVPGFPSPAEMIAPDREWRGPSHRVGSLLVWGEQGLGDQIFFARDLNRLTRIVPNVTVVVHPRLAGVFRRSFTTIDVVSGLPSEQLRQSMEAEILIGDLGAHLAPEQGGPFLVADPVLVSAARRHRAAGARRMIGLSWQGGITGHIAPVRSLGRGHVARLIDTCRRPDLDWLSLQHGLEPAEHEAICRDLGIRMNRATTPGGDTMTGDMDALVATIAGLDLLVSVNNTNVHVAGALGVPTLVLLPHVATWLWGTAGDRPSWYPATRVLRQEALGGWDRVIDRAVDAINSMI